MKNNYLTFIFLIFCGNIIFAQSLTLPECYRLAKENYPLAKQHDLIAKSSDYTLENLAKGYLPQATLNAQATYQSAVTEMPIKLPGVSTDPINKDQYKVYVDVTQNIYDGGMIKQQQNQQKANTELQQKQLEVQLYQLKDRVNQLFFGILSLDEQLKINALIKSDIQYGLNKIQAQYKNGTALKSNVNILKAEILKNEQRQIELQSIRKASLLMLGELIHQSLSEATILIKPAEEELVSDEIRRPELTMFEAQSTILNSQDELLKAKNRPKVSLFAQGGYGRPALNMLNNDFELYYMGGVRLSFPLSGFYTRKNDQNLIEINRQNIEIQKENFVFNTNLTATQQREDWNKTQQLIQTDDAIIALRNQNKIIAQNQLDNGVITANDYMKEVEAENIARQNKSLHQIQALMASYNLKNTLGLD